MRLMHEHDWSKLSKFAVYPGFLRAVALASSVAVAPAIIGNCGVTVFARYSVVQSLITILSFVDFGTSNTLVNILAKSREQLWTAEIKVRISVVLVLSIFGLAISGYVLIAIHPAFLPTWILRFQLHVVLLACLTAVAINLINRLLLGLEKVRATLLQPLLGNLFFVISLEVGTASDWPEVLLLWSLASVASQVPGMYLLLRSFSSQKIQGNRATPLSWTTSLEMARSMVHTGLFFLFLNLTGSLTFYAAPLIADYFCTPREVALLSAQMRLMSVPTALIGATFVHLWPQMAAMRAAEGMHSVQSLLRTATKSAGLLASLVGVVMFFLMTPILKLWVPELGPPPLLSVIAASAAAMLGILATPLSMMINGIEARGFQYLAGTVSTLMNLALSVVLTSKFGASGTLAALALSHGFCFVLPGLLRYLGGTARDS